MKRHIGKIIVIYCAVLFSVAMFYFYVTDNQRTEVAVLDCNGNRPVDILISHEQFVAADPTKLGEHFEYLLLTGERFGEKEAEYKKKHPEDLVIGNSGLIFSNDIPDPEFFKS